MTKRSKKTSDSKEAVLSIRIRPKVKYGLELVARKQHRAVSAVVETIAVREIARSLEKCPVGFFGEEAGDPYFDLLWATTEVERLSRLVTYAPELMTYDDTRLWEVVLSLGANERVWGGFSIDVDHEGLSVLINAVDERTSQLPDGWVVHGLYSWENKFVKTLNAGLLHSIWGDIKALSEDTISRRELEKKIKTVDQE